MTQANKPSSVSYTHLSFLKIEKSSLTSMICDIMLKIENNLKKIKENPHGT